MKDKILPCNLCTACCRGKLRLVAIFPYEDETQWNTLYLPKSGWYILANKDNGDCVYITDEGCAIWDRRPKTCREYDCREAMQGQEARIIWPHVAEAAMDLTKRMEKEKDESR